MPIDAELVRRKAALILDDLRRLKPFADHGRDAYLANGAIQLATERRLERMIDINFHLCVELLGVAPRDYHESFLKLAELRVITTDQSKKHARAAGLRNRLAHDYDGLDPSRVHEAAGHALTGVPEFLRSIEEFVAAESKSRTQ
jgi:uncharacterized protein YutE (UPF0331/DUF86 family)